jgi:predicted acyltransferase
MNDSRTDTFDPGRRLLSLDLFRGLTMFLLVAEGTHLYSVMIHHTAEGSFLHFLGTQFHHHPWNGLRFWDLIQPFFMFIVGVAMVFSLRKRQSRGESRSRIVKHILIRCVTLFFLGVILHCGYSGKLVWELWNVLTQLSFTILIAYLLLKLPFKVQLMISFALLGLTEAAYRLFPIEGFNQPFVMGHNLGSWMDLRLMGKINRDGWVAINCIPTAAHTIWGVLAGKLIISLKTEIQKVRLLCLWGIIGIGAGYGLQLAGVTPIIKRICTSSFVLSSGGWCLLTLAFFYWLTDIQHLHKGVFFFSVVGMNSNFIYMFSQLPGSQWLNRFVSIFTTGFLSWSGMADAGIRAVTALVTLGFEWALCYWLYRHRIFIRI